MKRKYLFFPLFLLSTVFSANAQMLKSHDVDPEAPSSTFGYFNTCPESPDGKYIAYVRFNTVPKGKKNTNAALWLLNRNTNKRFKLVDIPEVPVHNGAQFCWVDNKTIIFQDGRTSSLNQDNYDKFENGRYDYIASVNIDTKKVRRYDIRGHIGHISVGGNVPVSVFSDRPGYVSGAYELSVYTGKSRLICRPNIFKDMVPEEIKKGREDNVLGWKLLHLSYSPDGKKLSMRMDVRGHGEKLSGGGPQHTFVTIYTDGTHPVFFGPKPLHNNWYDNNSIVGHCGDPKDGPIREGTSDLLKEYKGGGVYHFQIYPEVKCLGKLAPFGNHLGYSRDGEWFASENWYREDSVEMRIYKKYDTKPRAIAFKNRYKKRTWDDTIHCNPSFSADGKRVYFTEVIDGNKFQARWVNIDDINKPDLWLPVSKYNTNN